MNPEIDLLLRTAIWNYSVRLHSATFGQRLLFITYNKDQLTKQGTIYKHFFLNVLLKYIRDNITFRWTDQRALQKVVTYCENVIAFVTVINFFRFLNVGKRPSLVDYILGLDNISMYGNRRREIGYSHMTRELIWGGFMVSFWHVKTHISVPCFNHNGLRIPFISLIGATGLYITSYQLPLC